MRPSDTIRNGPIIRRIAIAAAGFAAVFYVAVPYVAEPSPSGRSGIVVQTWTSSSAVHHAASADHLFGSGAEPGASR